MTDHVHETDPTAPTAHLFLDAVVAYDPEDEESLATGAALQKIVETGAIEVEVDPDTDELEVDVSALLSAAFLVTNFLAQSLAETAGVSLEDVVAKAREYVDEAAAQA